MSATAATSDVIRFYEVMFLVDPNQGSEASVVLDQYKKMITEKKGKIHRTEDLGMRDLAYTIKGLRKAHYALMNFACRTKDREAFEQALRYDEKVIRYLIVKREDAITKPSTLMRLKQEAEKESKKDQKKADKQTAAHAAKSEDKPVPEKVQKADQGAQSVEEGGADKK